METLYVSKTNSIFDSEINDAKTSSLFAAKSLKPVPTSMSKILMGGLPCMQPPIGVKKKPVKFCLKTAATRLLKIIV